MKDYSKKLTCLILCLLLLLPAAGCTAVTSSGDGCLNLVDSPSTTLNNVWYNTGGIFRCAVFESLVAAEADMKTIKPALAEKYSCSNDETTYQFVLRKNIKWHDGQLLDAEDVVFSVKAMLRSPKVNGLLSSAFQYVDGAEAYKSGAEQELRGISVSGNTITFRLITPVGNFLHAVAQLAILPEHILGEVDPDQLETSDYWHKPVGCGPYKITEAVPGAYFLLERNTDYYGVKPRIAKIRLQLDMEDPVAAMQDGTLDFYMTNDPEESAKLKGSDNCSAHRLNILFPVYLIFNLSEDAHVNEDLKKVQVRRALLQAIDRKTVVNVLFPGSTVSDTMVPAWDDWYWDGAESYGFDPQGAKRLLQEAGFDFSKTLRLCYFTKGQATANLMSAIAVYWRAIGIRVELEMLEGSGSEHMFELRDYDICYKRLSAFDHGAIYEEMAGWGVMQSSIYHLPVYDTLIGRLDTTRSDREKEEIIARMQKLDQQYLLRLPLFALENIAFVNESRLEMPDVYGNLWYRYNLRFYDWRLA